MFGEKALPWFQESLKCFSITVCEFWDSASLSSSELRQLLGVTAVLAGISPSWLLLNSLWLLSFPLAFLYCLLQWVSVELAWTDFVAIKSSLVEVFPTLEFHNIVTFNVLRMDLDKGLRGDGTGGYILCTFLHRQGGFWVCNLYSHTGVYYTLRRALSSA